MKYEATHQKYLDFIEEYKQASNAATSSEVDANANVEQKNIATLAGEIHKKDNIKINRLAMQKMIRDMFDEDLANEYIRQLDAHEIYKHDETSLFPYCVSITMYPFLFKGMGSIGGCSKAPTHLNSFAGNFVNLVFAVASQFAGACSTPEFLLYLDYFIRKEYGDDYYLHADKIVDDSNRHRTIHKVITDVFEQIVYSLNQPAAARGFQSVFWNVAYYDHPYFDGMFGDFIFPDGTKPIWESLSWLQKAFMKWFNKERLRAPLTFPVETLNLLDDGEKYVDAEWADFASEMWSEGHSFFLYRSDSVDSLSSCCFAPETKILAKSSSNVFLMPIGELHNMKFNGNKENLCVYHNGSWVKAKTIRLPATDMYKIKTSNEKSVVATGNHLFPTLRGDVRADQLRTDDYILFNTMALDSFPEKDDCLTYEQGFLIGMYLGDGSIDAHGPCQQTVNFSINENKYNSCIDKMNKALADMSIEGSFTLGKPINNVYPVRFYGNALAIIIRKYVTGNYANEKRLDASVYLQSKEFRHGIIDGLYATDGGNNNRIYSTSKGLIEDIECLCSTLGLNTIIDVSDRTDEPVIIRGKSYTRNYPLYCLRWYEPKNKRTMGDIFKIVNNGMYFRVSEVSPIDDYAHDFVYCFEVANADEPYFTLPNGMISHNCRLRNELQDNTFSYTLGAGGVSTGSKAVITMNINRLVQNAVRDGKDISEAVREQTRKIHKYLMAYNEIVRNFFNSRMLPVYDAGFISMEKQYLTIGINGFVEGAEFLGIKPCPNDQYFAYGEMILKPIYEENKKARTKELMFNTECVPAENLGVKNAAWDKKDGYFVPRDCYNSYFYIVEDETSNLLDKFILHGDRMTRYLDGGSALHANLDEHLSKAQYRRLMDVAIKTKCPYFTYNIPNTVCNDCGFISKHRLTECPKCHSHNLDYLTRVIGYLKRVSAFSQARQEEEKRRYYEKV